MNDFPQLLSAIADTLDARIAMDDPLSTTEMKDISYLIHAAALTMGAEHTLLLAAPATRGTDANVVPFPRRMV